MSNATASTTLPFQIDLYLWATYNEFIAGQQVLFKNFPSTDYLVFLAEERNPYASGGIYSYDFAMSDWCCEDGLVHVKARLPAAVDKALVDSKDKSEDEDQEPTRIQVCFCSIWEKIITKYTSVRPKSS
jgi:hypothetical protein